MHCSCPWRCVMVAKKKYTMWHQCLHEIIQENDTYICQKWEKEQCARLLFWSTCKIAIQHIQSHHGKNKEKYFQISLIKRIGEWTVKMNDISESAKSTIHPKMAKQCIIILIKFSKYVHVCCHDSYELPNILNRREKKWAKLQQKNHHSSWSFRRQTKKKSQLNIRIWTVENKIITLERLTAKVKHKFITYNDDTSE